MWCGCRRSTAARRSIVSDVPADGQRPRHPSPGGLSDRRTTVAIVAQSVDADASASAQGSTAPLPHRQVVTILIGLMLGMFLAALDQTVVATAMRTIADDLN